MELHTDNRSIVSSSSEIIAATEFESTISVKISEDEYERAIGQTDILFFFKDGSRLSNHRIERKVILSEKNVFGFHDGFVFPIKRTTANERLCSIDPLCEVQRATHRKLVRLPNGIRVSHNKIECENGVMYLAEYEIEYAEAATYDHIIELEELLMLEVISDKRNVNTTDMSLENIFACVMTKVQMWHCFDETKPYVWAYKWNGVKAKLFVHEDTNKAYLWRDADNIKIVDLVGYHEIMKNLCFVVEVMDDIVVIIEVVGSRFDDAVYLSDPSTNLKMLRYLKTLMRKREMRIDGKPLIAQTFFDSPMPRYETSDDYDGFIIVQDHMVIKWKIPTVDVQCLSGRIYVVANGRHLELDTPGEAGSIYEISPNFKIIRKRNDRVTGSTEQEFDVFIRSIAMLSGRTIEPPLIDESTVAIPS